MAKVIYTYNGMQTTIQCDVQDLLRDINKKFLAKVETELDKVYFLYDGDKVKEDLTFQEAINDMDKESNTMRVLVNEINKESTKEVFMKSEEIICPKCNESIRIHLKDYKINLYECINNHKIDNLSFTEFDKSQNINLSNIICNNCKEVNKGNSYNNDFYKCCSCGSYLCPLCKTIHDKKHKIINYEQKYYICDKHKDNYSKYCEQCKKNICMLCEKEHKGHKNIYFGDIMPDKDSIIEELNEFKKKIDMFNNTIKDIIKRLNNVIDNVELYYTICNNIFNYYDIQKRNYQILNNINEFQNYNNIIIIDINKINDEDNIYNKFKLIMNVYNKMNNILNEIDNNKKRNELISEYINKINYKFKGDPQNLKYKLDFNVLSKSQGYNDAFEVFISYKDNKEYLVARNTDNNNNLDVFTLFDNKKILSLKGHENLITTIRYFINNKDNNEYLVSADWNYKVIVWDVSNNFNIKYKIGDFWKLHTEMWTLMLVFPHNNDNNYIVISSSVYIKNPNVSNTQIYSLSDGQFIKYVKNVDCEVWYLLSWYNKKNDKYYIVQLGSKKIIINNLLEDEVYTQFINEPEDNQVSGFIYNKDNNDYLCSSSVRGFINIWDLFNKTIYKTINTNIDTKNYILYHIIQWNSKYAIVATQNKSFKIVDLENEKVVSEVKAHYDEVICVKKVYHPTFGESLITSSRDKKIKLWTF